MYVYSNEKNKHVSSRDVRTVYTDTLFQLEIGTITESPMFSVVLDTVEQGNCEFFTRYSLSYFFKPDYLIV